MAHPKSKISKQRKRKRRTHYNTPVPNVMACTNCGNPILRHHVCDECGHYRGKPAIVFQDEE